ncbi:hypothetical protein LVJ85_08335 [Neisseria sp. Dent CA1/247]|uniref:hypothetical protein n=1 Tax=Neisseria sp. Dent CA1/247 TaxID=2912675 RepID=UPI001FD1115B|nr:hypothetical protein [Neisseria sp. Dent CA1/247]UOO76055.1 hypothetical protein LVJ85_08335 [Neisseria sp. Dent CA1/247]
METNHTRRLLAAVKALAEVDIDHAASTLPALLPIGYLDAYADSGGTAFDQDMLDIFAVAIEDYFWENEEAIKAESPDAYALLSDGISDLFEPCEPGLYLNDPAAWQDYRRNLKAFADRLETVLPE